MAVAVEPVGDGGGWARTDRDLADIAARIGFLEAGRIVDEAAAQGADRFDVRDLHRKFTAESVAA